MKLNITKGQMDKLTLAIPKNLKEAAKERAKLEDTSVSRFVRQILRAWVAGWCCPYDELMTYGNNAEAQK